MESGTESVELLVTKDSAAAYEISKRIDKYNKDRKELDRQITEEANKIIESHKNQIMGKKPIVIYDRNWHKGIIGIVASRLAELYFRPSVVLTYDDNGLATGSSRSVRGFNIYAAIKSTRDLLETFGGHTNAVGLSLKEETSTSSGAASPTMWRSTSKPTKSRLKSTLTVSLVLRKSTMTFSST